MISFNLKLIYIFRLISRLNLLRTDLRRGITGMNAALNPKTEKSVESAAAGDA